MAAGNVDSRTPELAYMSKPNILIPKSDARSATVVRDLASAADRLMVIPAAINLGVGGGTAGARVAISGADPAATRTYAAADKEV